MAAALTNAVTVGAWRPATPASNLLRARFFGIMNLQKSWSLRPDKSAMAEAVTERSTLSAVLTLYRCADEIFVSN